jgi:hypothetical protein
MSDNPNNSLVRDEDEANSLTPELVRQVTDKVYKLLLQELKHENERRRVRNPLYRR